MIPWTGELVEPTPAAAAASLENCVTFYAVFRAFQEACRDVLRAESDKRGQRTFVIEGHTVEVNSEASSQEIVYDTDRMWNELLDAGLPGERLSHLITLVPKVDGTILRQLKANPEYAKIIEGCVLSTKQRARRVVVK
jgi:hypothetical protein